VAHILIVDDDQVVGETFARMLTLEGYRVTSVQSVDAALAATATEAPDALIIDMRMPVVSGLDFLRLLRRDSRLREVPVAIVTVVVMFAHGSVPIR